MIHGCLESGLVRQRGAQVPSLNDSAEEWPVRLVVNE
jgi:hypothetical protein